MIERILDRKRSSVQSREQLLGNYVRYLTGQYLQEDIHHKLGLLVATFLKSIKAETSEKETVLALKGIIFSPIDINDLCLTLYSNHPHCRH